MLNFELFKNKKRKKAIGVLSGTSADAVDIALMDIMNCGKDIQISDIDYEEFPISKKIRNYIFDITEGRGNAKDICRLNILLGKMFADKINYFLRERGIPNNEIDFIGSHGQTIYHEPKLTSLFGYRFKSTLQVGDPSVICNSTGILTVGDFRIADVSFNGDGAPLVPYLDYILFNKKDTPRILLNIGGIANLTYLPSNSQINNIIAFDTGPGNMLIDSISKMFFNKKYDKDGKIAKKGNLNIDLFEYLIENDKYFKKTPPKSTGREYYGKKYLKFLKKFKNISPEDILHTLTKFTAYSIAFNIKKFIKINTNSEILVSGGGAENNLLMDFLENELNNILISKLNYEGINHSNKEAVLFAVLANETLCGNPSNLTNVTNSNKNTLLGKICVPFFNN